MLVFEFVGGQRRREKSHLTDIIEFLEGDVIEAFLGAAKRCAGRFSDCCKNGHYMCGWNGEVISKHTKKEG